MASEAIVCFFYSASLVETGTPSPFPSHILFTYFWFLRHRQGLLCNWGWPWTSDRPASNFQVWDCRQKSALCSVSTPGGTSPWTFESACEWVTKGPKAAVRRSAQTMTMTGTHMETHWYFLGFVFSCFVVVVQKATASKNSVSVNSKMAVSRG